MMSEERVRAANDEWTKSAPQSSLFVLSSTLHSPIFPIHLTSRRYLVECNEEREERAMNGTVDWFLFFFNIYNLLTDRRVLPSSSYILLPFTCQLEAEVNRELSLEGLPRGFREFQTLKGALLTPTTTSYLRCYWLERRHSFHVFELK
jgi:hypothetical protein